MRMEADSEQVSPDGLAVTAPAVCASNEHQRGEPLVSVVIPARDEEAYVESALASVASQRYHLGCLECIVVDNASSDATAQVAVAFANRQPELKVSVVTEPTVGVACAKNLGARVARGRILVFLDADSQMDGDLIKHVVARYRDGSPAGSIRVAADSDDWLERAFFDLMEVGKVLFGIRSQMMYCDRALFLALGGFRPDLRVAEDLEFLRRVKAHLRHDSGGDVCHIRSSLILTSPRRLRTRPFRLGLLTLFVRWALAFVGIGRNRSY
mgnify:CR=1 FL=1